MLKIFRKKAPASQGSDEDANLPAVAEGSDDDATAPAKKKLPLLFIIAPVAAVLVAGGGATAFLMLKPKSEAHAADAGSAGHAAPKKSDKKGAAAEADPALGVITQGPDGVTFYALPDMVVNIQSPDGRASFLKLKLTLEMRDAALAHRLMAEHPRMNDMFQGFLRELRPEDLAGSAGSHQLRAEILRRVNLVAAPRTVDAVLIEEMLVQ